MHLFEIKAFAVERHPGRSSQASLAPQFLNVLQEMRGAFECFGDQMTFMKRERDKTVACFQVSHPGLIGNINPSTPDLQLRVNSTFIRLKKK